MSLHVGCQVGRRVSGTSRGGLGIRRRWYGKVWHELPLRAALKVRIARVDGGSFEGRSRKIGGRSVGKEI